jgi:hypothetical protein
MGLETDPVKEMLCSLEHQMIDEVQKLSNPDYYTLSSEPLRKGTLFPHSQCNILLHVHPLLGNGLVNKFPRIQILGKQSVTRLCNNRKISVNILTATNTGNNRINKFFFATVVKHPP